jgi:hypothetical protein
MLTGGFKTRGQAEGAVTCGAIDIVGLARALVLEPSLPNLWKEDQKSEPSFPRFPDAPEGGITAWYTMRLAEIGADNDPPDSSGLEQAVRDYAERDKQRTKVWLTHFANEAAGSS